MKKFVKRILVIFLVIIVILSVTRNFVVRFVVERGVQAVTGLPLRMKSLNIGVMTTELGIKDLKLFNPENFPDKVMVDLPEIYVDYEFLPLLKKKAHLKEVRIHLNEFVIVKNKDGEVNLDTLKALKKEKPEEVAEKKEPAKKEKKASNIQIDLLSLKVGKVIYKDYSKGGEPSIKEWNINLDEKIEDIKEMNTLVRIIVFKALTPTGVSSLIGFDMSGLKSAVSGTLDSAQKITEGAVDITGEALKKTTESITDVIKMPFGQQ